MQYNWINDVAKMLPDYTSTCFYDLFNDSIDFNSLPENLTTLIFGWRFAQ